jgi:CRISPR-associated protein Cas1
MSTLVIEKRELELEYTTDCLLIRQTGEPVRSLPLSRVTKIVCMHSVKLSTQLLGQLYQRNIDFIVLNSRYVKHSFAIHADPHQHALRRCQQYAWQLDPQLRFNLSQSLCIHKFRISIRVIPAIQQTSLAAQLEMAIESAQQCQNEHSLRGIEGSVQRALFQHWRTQLDPNWGFNQRLRRPPPDPVNALLSLTYTLVHQEAIRQAKRYGLDPDLGFYHLLAYSRQSLACDLMEPLRPKVEKWLVGILQQSQLTRRHFSKANASGCFLGKEGRLVFYPLLDEFMRTTTLSLAANARWVTRKLKNQPAKWATQEHLS